MKLFIRMLIAATIINFFVLAYHTPPVFQNFGSGGSTFSSHIAALQKEHQRLFSVATETALRGSLFRFHQIQDKFGPTLYRLKITPELLALAKEFSAAAREHLTVVESFRDNWLNDMSLVKKDLTDLLRIEIKIWDSIIGLSNLKYAMVSFDQQFIFLAVQSARLAETMKKVSAKMDT